MVDYAGLIIEREDGKCLFQLRDDKDIDNPNLWGIFGGGIRKNEKPLSALVRELREELSFKFDKSKVKLLVSYDTLGKKWFIYHIKVGRNVKFKLKVGQKMEYFHPYSMVFNNKAVFVMRLFLVFYPLMKWMKGL